MKFLRPDFLIGQIGRRARPMRLLLNAYPPFVGAGIIVERIASNFLEIDVVLRGRTLTRNAVGVQFGGSLYAMCDPFFMLMVMHHLSEAFVVWDKSGNIQYLRPAVGDVRAAFRIPITTLENIRDEANETGRALPQFHVDVVDGNSIVVARVEKVISVKPRKAAERPR